VIERIHQKCVERESNKAQTAEQQEPLHTGGRKVCRGMERFQRDREFLSCLAPRLARAGGPGRLGIYREAAAGLRFLDARSEFWDNIK